MLKKIKGWIKSWPLWVVLSSLIAIVVWLVKGLFRRTGQAKQPFAKPLDPEAAKREKDRIIKHAESERDKIDKEANDARKDVKKWLEG